VHACVRVAGVQSDDTLTLKVRLPGYNRRLRRRDVAIAGGFGRSDLADRPHSPNVPERFKRPDVFHVDAVDDDWGQVFQLRAYDRISSRAWCGGRGALLKPSYDVGERLLPTTTFASAHGAAVTCRLWSSSTDVVWRRGQTR